MPVWTLTLLVDRVPSLDQAQALRAASVLLEVTPQVVRARFDWPARSLIEALSGAMSAVEGAGMRVLRIDASDWVTCQDIADRVGRSRETVRLWTQGRLGRAGFPPPLNLGRGTTLYSWAEVLPWLRRHLGGDVPEEEPVLAAANLVLQLRRLAPRLSDPSAVWRLGQAVSR